MIEGAYGADGDLTRLKSSLGPIAQSLNNGDFARAAMVAVLTRTPELSDVAAERLATAYEELTKYNPDEPRDWHGRWTKTDAAGSVSISAPADLDAARRAADLLSPHVSEHESGDAEEYASNTPVAAPEAGHADDEDSESHEPTSLEQTFERKYDDLGPVEFAKQVIQFGDRLGRQGKDLSAAEKERALAEYYFLQVRLSFWLGYEYKPLAAQAYLLSAALTLFQGANIAGIVHPPHMPRSMLDVAGAVALLDNPPSRPRFSMEPAIEGALAVPLRAPREVEGLGGIAGKDKVGIEWNKGIQDQSAPLERYIHEQIPDAKALSPTSKTFDIFNPVNGEAISAKTLNTLSVSYIRNPQRIYWRMKRYIDAAADYAPRVDTELRAARIRSKTIQLAIPEYTSPSQWDYLYQAIVYGKRRGVSIVITRIRE